ncbi:MAG: AsmA family protein [Alphaproteobacteria bacterium]|nr:AsmA family protein [Alphaproteobacteria bacterium]
MKKFFLVLGVLVVLLVGAVIAAPLLVPTETIKSQLTAQVEAATGRKLTVDGDLDLSVLPNLGVDMGDVHFANAPGSEVADMVSLKSLKVELKALPLLTGSVEIDRFVLVEPMIHLEVDADGKANWALEAGGDQAAASDDAASEDSSSGDATLPITELKLGDIRIENGSLTFVDRAAGSEERIEAINMQLALADIRSPLEAEGSLDYKGETIELDLDLEAPYDVIQGDSSAFALGIESTALALGFDGQLSNQGAPSAAGSIDLSVPSVKGLAAWLAEPLDLETEALEALTIKGQLNGSAERIAFTDATLSLDKISGRGEVSADLTGSVPKVSARLDLGMVDINPYMPGEAPAPSEEGGASPTEGDASPDWSDEPIELAIGGVDLAFELTLEGLKANEVKLGRTVLALNMTGPKLTADLKEFALYQGNGQGRLVVDAASGQPRIEKQFTLSGLETLPFLTDAAEFERLEGKADAEFQFSTTGGTERQLVENMNGDGKVTFTDGAIVGINVAAMVRNVGSAFLNAEANEARKTDFAELGGSFTIENGVLTNDDLLLQAPALRIGGAGVVDLPKRQVDYRIEPKAAATLQGQEGQSEVAGVLVPVNVEGPFEDLSFKPDLSSLVDQAINDPDALKEQVKQQLGTLGDATKDVNSVGDIKKKLKNVDEDDAKNVLDKLTQGEGDDGESPAGKLLKGLLKN